MKIFKVSSPIFPIRLTFSINWFENSPLWGKPVSYSNFVTIKFYIVDPILCIDLHSRKIKMDYKYYLQKFQQAADQLDKDLLGQYQLEVAVGVVLDSVYLKLYKKSWATALQDPLTAESRIFFSIWVNA